MNRLKALSACAVFVSFAGVAHADVVFSQPPIPGLGAVQLPGLGFQSLAPFVASTSSHMTALSFWAWNGQIGTVPTTVSIQFFSEAFGGGVGAELFGASLPLASLDAEATASTNATKHTYHLPASESLVAGDRYFVSITGLESDLRWVYSLSGEDYWYGPVGGPFAENGGLLPLSFEIHGEPANAIPLPSGALMGLAGFGMLASFRRRR